MKWARKMAPAECPAAWTDTRPCVVGTELGEAFTDVPRRTIRADARAALSLTAFHRPQPTGPDCNSAAWSASPASPGPARRASPAAASASRQTLSPRRSGSGRRRCPATTAPGWPAIVRPARSETTPPCAQKTSGTGPVAPARSASLDEGRQMHIENGVHVSRGGLHDAVIGEFTQGQVHHIRPKAFEIVGRERVTVRAGRLIPLRLRPVHSSPQAYRRHSGPGADAPSCRTLRIGDKHLCNDQVPTSARADENP